MARLLSTTFGISIDLDGDVGPGRANAREDVGIVQYALMLLTRGSTFGMPGGLPGKTMFTVPGQKPIAVDGAYGPQTKAYIAAYQAVRKNAPGPGAHPLSTPNGIFSSQRGAGPGWVFGVLSQDVEHRLGHGKLLDRLKHDPAAPPWLKSAFFA